MLSTSFTVVSYFLLPVFNFLSPLVMLFSSSKFSASACCLFSRCFSSSKFTASACFLFFLSPSSVFLISVSCVVSSSKFTAGSWFPFSFPVVFDHSFHLWLFLFVRHSRFFSSFAFVSLFPCFVSSTFVFFYYCFLVLSSSCFSSYAIFGSYFPLLIDFIVDFFSSWLPLA